MSAPSVKRNYAYNIIIQLFTLLAPMITMPYVSRILEADFIGYYSYANSIASYFTLFAALGVAAYGAREVSLNRNDRIFYSETFWELTGIRAVTTAAMLVFYTIAVFVNGVNIPVYIACGVSILAVSLDFTWFLQAMEDFKSVMVRNFFIKTVSVIAIFLFVKEKNDLAVYICIQTVSVLLANIIIIPKLKKYLVPIRFSQLSFAPHFKQIIVYFVPTIATSVYTVLDRTMLGVITRDTLENGYYEQGHKIINIMLTVITSLNVIIGMRNSYLFGKGDDERIKKYIRKAFRFMSLISIPMAFGLVATARNFVPIFFGEGYDKVAPVMMLFSPIVFFIGISNIIGNTYLTPSGQRSRANRVLILGAFINFILNLVLIPSLKSYGAVIASLAAEGIIALFYILLMKRYLTVWDVFKAAIKYVIISAVMLAVVWPISFKWQGPVSLTLQVGLGIAIYFLGLFITRDEILFEFLRAVKRKIKGGKSK